MAVPALLRYLIKRDRGKLKAALIKSVLGNISRAQLEAWNARFVPALMARGLFKDALAQIAAHRQANDRLVLMSASPDLYVPAIAHALGFDETICTEVSWMAGRLQGDLLTPNRRGAEKVRCVQALRARHPTLSVRAYGNAASDLAHLVLADEGVLVNGSQAARRQAEAQGIECVLWR